jgi:hypothetical protein
VEALVAAVLLRPAWVDALGPGAEEKAELDALAAEKAKAKAARSAWRRKKGAPAPEVEPKKPTEWIFVSDDTIRHEMVVFKAVMDYAASRRYIPADHRFGELPKFRKNRRDEFTLEEYRRAFSAPRTDPPPDDTHRYRASKADCDACTLKSRCCPNTPARKVTRSIYEGSREFAREIAKTEAYVTSRRQRKKVEMLFAHLKQILKPDRLRLRGPCGARDEFLLAATAQNLRKLAKLIPPATPAMA